LTVNAYDRNQFFYSLQVFRFIAALLVALSHVGSNWPHNLIIYKFLIVGGIGLSFFFVLSGFVLMWGYSSSISAKYFIYRRCIRIYPIHILCLFISLAAFKYLGSPLAGYPDSGSLWEKVCNLLLIHSWIPTYWTESHQHLSQTWNGVTWTLSCELFFYIFAPFIFKRLINIKISTTICFIVFGYLLNLMLRFYSEYNEYNNFSYCMLVSPLFRIYEFILGACAAKIIVFTSLKDIHNYIKTNKHIKFLIVIFCALFLFIPYCFGFIKDKYVYTTAYLSVSGWFLLIIIFSYIDFNKMTPRLFKNKFLLLLGNASFIFYMIHALLLGLSLFILSKIYFRYDSLVNEVYTIYFIIFTAFLSIIIYLYLDNPLQQRLKKLVKTSHAAETAETSVNLGQDDKRERMESRRRSSLN
jgi:mycarose O-acyltransferase